MYQYHQYHDEYIEQVIVIIIVFFLVDNGRIKTENFHFVSKIHIEHYFTSLHLHISLQKVKCLPIKVNDVYSYHRVVYLFFRFFSSAVMALMQNESESVREKTSCKLFRTDYGYVMTGKYKFLSIPRGM
jgi:hypothetical protein